MVTAETAVAMPFIVVLALVLFWAVSLGVSQVRLTDTSHDAARMLARGDPVDSVKAAVRESMGSDMDMAVNTENGKVEVVVTMKKRPPLLPTIGVQTLTSHAVAQIETAPGDEK